MKLNKIAALLAVAGMSAPAFATNGDNLIGLGVQSRALGGTGTAAYYGAENALTNPALLGKLKGTEFSFAATAFMPDVKATTNVATFPASASKTSESDLYGIPEVSLAHRIDNNWVVGIGMFGTAGMGVDYRGNPGLFEATSSLMTMKFVPSVAYNATTSVLGLAWLSNTAHLISTMQHPCWYTLAPAPLLTSAPASIWAVTTTSARISPWALPISPRLT